MPVEHGGHVYIVASRMNGTLYTGVTSDLVKRAYQHRHGLMEGFSKRYGCRRLVWYEAHAEIVGAIRREKQIKEWKRAWKIQLIEAVNPGWRDLAEPFLGPAALGPGFRRDDG
ncbi:MAG: GIY-YIG nuclease family protein [Sphingomonadaceae bacterium]|nr:GIY-YIG nuclease family protein [Sphingomonadaceae bacterium]